MNRLWILLAALAAAAGGLVARSRLRGRRPLRAEITNLSDETSVERETGAVRSVQRADLLIDGDALEELWTAVNLERLARTYWRFLTRVTLGLIQVRYSDRGRAIVLLGEPFRLLTFRTPEYEIEGERALVRWRIERGLLVARRGRGEGFLQIEVMRGPEEAGGRRRLHVEVAVVNFYPAIASAISLRLYDLTQSRIHVIVTHAFLRSLAHLDLAESRVGQLESTPR